jgi:ubiquinone/menaquinone biosynthesis C-methylase UbiE
MAKKFMLSQIESFYDKHAQDYFSQRTVEGGRLFNEYIDMPATKEMLSGRIHKGSTLLDIGSGIGSYARHYAERGLDVTAIDISENMLEIAKKFCEPYKVKFKKQSFQEFKGRKASFDFVLGSFMLSYFDDLEAAFKKMSDLMKPNGMAVLSMLHPVKLSVKQRHDGMFCISNYFDSGDYTTDLNFHEDQISIKKWTLDDIAYCSKKANLYIDQIKEPKPDTTPNAYRTEGSFYLSCPSIMIFAFKKRSN